MADDTVKSIEAQIERMDRVAGALLTIVETEGTSEQQKGRLFAQCLAWYKVRPTLVPSGEGNKLKEMENAIGKAGGGKRGGSTGRAGKSGAAASPDGRKIAAIIKNLPKPGQDRDSGRADGDTEDPQREGGSDAGDGGVIRLNGGGNGAGDADGAVHSNLV